MKPTRNYFVFTPYVTKMFTILKLVCDIESEVVYIRIGPR